MADVNGAGLQVIDVSNPAAPFRVGGYDTGGAAYGVAVVGSFVYVAGQSTGLAILRTTNRGDLNCDGWFDGADIWPFFIVLDDPDEFAAEYPNCNINNADINGDGAVDGADIQPFFAALSGGG